MAKLLPYTKPDLKTSQGLYGLANQSGLQNDADRILKSQSGEDTKKIFSGGFISDIFDVMNALQYGVTGVLKGKSFSEGVKTRQSFSDKDALGDNGIPGVIAGIALDIAVDPLTYIAPATILKKIPGAVTAGKAIKGAVFGKMAEKTIETGSGLQKLQMLEGGTKIGKWFGDKFPWMFGVDPIYRNTYEKGIKNIAVGTQNTLDLVKGTTKLIPEIGMKLGSFDEAGRVIRTADDVLKKTLNPQDYEIAKRANDTIRGLSKEMVDLKMISRETAEKNIDTYIQNNYMEFLQKKGEKGLFGSRKLKVGGIKKRVEGLTPERMKELGQVTNMPFLFMKTAVDMRKDIETVKLFNQLAKMSSDVAQEGFKQLPVTKKLFTTSTGEKIELFSKIKNLNLKLKSPLKELKYTFRADKQILSEIHSIESQIDNLSKLRSNEFLKFFQEGQKISKVIPESKLIRGVGKLPEHLNDIGNNVSKFNNFKELMKSKTGIQLEGLYNEGILERSGFKKMEDFFDFVKKPFVETSEKVVETISKGDLSQLVKLQSQIEKLMQKSGNIREITKSSINDSFINLERTINIIRSEKEGLIEQIGKVKLGELSGKWVPESIYKYIQEISEPAKWGIGKQLIADFKFFKVVMNPATNARNIASNKILNWWKLDMNPLDPRVIKTDATAVKEIFKKGGKWTEMFKPYGYGLDTMASNEIYNLLDNPGAASLAGTLGGKWSNFKKTFSSIYQAEENSAKLSAAIFNTLHKGMTPENAWKAAEVATFNYAQVTPFIRKLRTSLFGFPFITFCVSSDTEILTDKGWKTFDFIDVKNDLTLAYDIETKELVWQKIEDVYVFPYSGKMVSIKSRSLDILMTPNHRNVIERTLHRRKTGNKNKIMIDEAKNLTKADKIIVAGNYIAPKEKTIPDEMVELVGWFITEGYLVKKYNAMFIGQTNPEGQIKIEELRKKLGTEKYHIGLRRYKLGGYKLHKVYYFPAKIRDKVLKLAPNKELRTEFLKKLTKEQLELLYQTILLADGHNPKNKKSNPIIIQNQGETANSIQILGVMLGKQFGWTRHDNGLGITITKGYKRQLKRNMPIKVDYNGIVWCPKTELGTWVARRNGKVFITGNTVKSTPIAIETALKHPQRISVFGKIKTAIENASDIKETARERASEPSYIKNGFYIKLPMKDKNGNSAYFDLTYIIPFGDLMSGNFFERQINRETGLPESIPEAGASKSPFFSLIKEISKNQDFYGDKIWKDSDSVDKQLGNLMRHLSKTFLPPLVADQIPGGFKNDGTQRQKGIVGALTTGDKATQQRTLMEEMLRNVGAKIQPIDADIQETYQEWNKKKALQTLLREKGIIKEFDINYLPK